MNNIAFKYLGDTKLKEIIIAQTPYTYKQKIAY